MWPAQLAATDKPDANEQGAPVSDTDAAYRRLEKLIVLTELKPGLMYSEKELADLVGFGRTPVREAIQRLAFEGLVVVRQRKGIQVTEADPDTQLRLLEVRRPLQNFAVEYAARRAGDADRERMARFAEELESTSIEKPTSRAQALAAVRQSHDLIVHACHNEFALRTLRIVQGSSRRFWIFHLKREDFAPAANLHARLLREVARGDANKAVDVSNALIDYLENFAQDKKTWK